MQAELIAVGVDHKELVRLGAKLAASQSRLGAAEERWPSLADEAEHSAWTSDRTRGLA